MATETKIFKTANDIIVDYIRKELRLQGHYLTGALEASLDAKEIAEAGGVTLTASALGYLETLQTGIAPEHISLSQQSINEMTVYVNRRFGYTGKYAIKVALMILKKQSKEGNPTKASYQFSRTGSRTEAVTDVFHDKSEVIMGALDVAAIGSLDNSFSKIKSGTI